MGRSQRWRGSVLSELVTLGVTVAGFFAMSPSRNAGGCRSTPPAVYASVVRCLGAAIAGVSLPPVRAHRAYRHREGVDRDTVRAGARDCASRPPHTRLET